MDLEGLRECALLLEEEDMLMEPSANPLFLVEDIMPERDRFIGVVGLGCGGCLVFSGVGCMFGWCFKTESNMFCCMFRCL